MPAGDFPIINIYEFNTSETASPLGNRHTFEGSFAFQQKVSLGCSVFVPGNASTSGVLTFENVRFNTAVPVSHIESKVQAIIFLLDDDPAASGTAVSNMRLYISDNSALMAGPNHDGSEPARLQFSPSGSWLPGVVLPSGSVSELPAAVPAAPNVFRQDGGAALLKQDDNNVSQFVYMNLVAPLGFPFGTFGVCGSGVLRLSLLFDYYNDDFVFLYGEP